MSFFEFPHTRTYDSDLGWIIKNIKTRDEMIAALKEWSENAEIRIEDLEAFKAAFEDGNLPDGVKDALLEWAALNVPDLIAEAIKTVFFTLNDSGHLVAHVPSSWDEITFNTSGYDAYPVGVDFGHLMLTY